MNPFDELAEMFRKFPGIGPRQAKRFAYHVIGLSHTETKNLSEKILAVKNSVKECTDCHRHFFSAKPSTVCNICANPTRKADELMIVATENDFEAVEKSRHYKGLYFILGGEVPVLEKVPSYIKKDALIKRIQGLKKKSLKEIIIAADMTPEGDHTAKYIRDLIEPLITGVALTSLGRGVSTGSELEYADGDTIANALSGRKKI